MELPVNSILLLSSIKTSFFDTQYTQFHNCSTKCAASNLRIARIEFCFFFRFTHHWICIHSDQLQKLQSESENNRILMWDYWIIIEKHKLVHSTALSRLFLVLCICFKLKLLIRIERNFIQSGQRLTFKIFDRFRTHARSIQCLLTIFIFPFIRNCFEFNADCHFLILRLLFNRLSRRIGNCVHAHEL